MVVRLSKIRSTPLGQGFILIVPQAAVLPASDAGNDVVKPTSGVVIRNRQTSCSTWCLMYGHAIRTWSAVCSIAPKNTKIFKLVVLVFFLNETMLSNFCKAIY